MARDPQVALGDILDAISGIRQALGSRDFEAFRADRMIRRAIEREIEIVSEASRHVPEDLKAQEPEIPWREIAGIGNVFRHDYQSVSDRIVWNVVEVHIAPLERAVMRLSSNLPVVGKT